MYWMDVFFPLSLEGAGNDLRPRPEILGDDCGLDLGLIGLLFEEILGHGKSPNVDPSPRRLGCPHTRIIDVPRWGQERRIVLLGRLFNEGP